MPTLSEGELLIQQFQDAGYSDEYIAREKETRTKAFIDAGGTMGEVDTFWGDNSDEGETLSKNMAVNNIKSAGVKIEELPVADGFWETLGASWGMSVTSLQTLRTPPTMQTKAPGDMTFGENVAAGIGALGDVPALVGGGGATLFATKTPWKVGAGAMAFTEANRQASIYSYRTTGKWSTSAWFRGLFMSPKEVAKAAFIGATVGKTGSIAYTAALKVAGERAALVAANAAGTVAGTAIGGAVNGEVPTGAEFTAAAVVAALLPGAHYKLSHQVAKEVGSRGRTVLTDAGEWLSTNFQDAWAKTALRPQDQVQIALNDKVARQSIVGRDVDGQIVAEPWSGYKSPEPEPYKKPAEVEIDGGMKAEAEKPKKPGVDVPAEDGLIEQLVPAENAKANPENGIMPVKSIGKEQLATIVDVDMTKEVTPEQLKVMEEAAKNYKMDDGSVDLEAVLIEHSEGAAAAQLFRANGRDYNNLSPKTQRFLEYVGNEIETDGYVPPPRKPQEGGGSGKPPPPPEEGAGLPAKDKPPGKHSKGEQGPIHGNRPHEEPFARDMEFVAEDINARIAKETQSSDFKDVWRRFKANWRELSPFAMVDKMLGIGGSDLGSIGLERIARLQYSAEDRFGFRIQKGGGGYRVTIDKHGKPAYEADYKVPTYYAISKDAKKLKAGVDGWNAFMMALDTVDRARQGKQTTTPLKEAQEAIQAVNDMPAKEREAYWKLSKDYQAMMEDSLYGSHFHGVISRAEIEWFRKQHPNYFPQKVALPVNDSPVKKSIKGLFRVAKGHKFMLKDPKLDTLETLFRREKFNNINLLRAKAVAELQKHFESSSSRELVPVAPKKIESVVLKEDGSIFTPDEETKFFKGNENEINYIADGNKMVYKVPEFPGRKVFMDALLSTSAFDRAVGIYGLTKVAAFTRAMITFMPPYIYKMVVRDSTQHAVASKYGGIPGMNLIRGAFDMVDFGVANGSLSGGKNLGWGKAMVDEAMINGAFVGGQQHMDMNPLMRNFHDIERTGFTGALINSVIHPAELLHKLTRMTDAAVRVGATYRGAREELGAIAAGDLARVRGGDFAEKSNNAVINNLASATPFWTGAARAGIDSTVQSVKSDPLGYGMRGVVKITVMAIGMSALMETLEEAYDVPEIDRVRNMDRKVLDNYMMIPWIWNGELYKFQLPLPQGMGAVFNSPVHRIREYMKTENPRAFKEWGWNVAMAFADTAKLGVDNPVVSSALEGYTGYDLSFNKPIVPQRFEHVTGHNAYHPYTSEVAKSASRWVGEPGLDLIDITPIMVEQQIKNFTGTLGKDLMRLYDINMKDTVSPADWANTPFIGSFFTRHAGLNSRPITDFYDELNTFRNMVGDSRIAKSRYDIPAMIKAEQDETMLVGMSEAAEAMRVMQGLSYGIMDAKREAYKDDAGKQMSDTDIANDKRQQIDNLATMMIGIARVQLDMLDQMRAIRDAQ